MNTQQNDQDIKMEGLQKARSSKRSFAKQALAKPKTQKLGGVLSMSDLDVDGDGTIDQGEVAVFVRFYNSFYHEFVSMKKLMLFLLFALLLSWGIVVALTIPLNLLAAEVSHTGDTGEVATKSGTPLAIRQSIASNEFHCDDKYLMQLQWLYLTPTHKSFIIDLKVDDARTYAIITTHSGVTTLLCPDPSMKRTSNGGEPLGFQATIAYSQTCGDGNLDIAEECDNTDSRQCSDCRCQAPFTHYLPPQTICNGCGNDVLDVGEECDGGLYCTSNCTILAPTTFEITCGTLRRRFTGNGSFEVTPESTPGLSVFLVGLVDDHVSSVDSSPCNGDNIVLQNLFYGGSGVQLHSIRNWQLNGRAVVLLQEDGRLEDVSNFNHQRRALLSVITGDSRQYSLTDGVSIVYYPSGYTSRTFSITCGGKTNIYTSSGPVSFTNRQGSLYFNVPLLNIPYLPTGNEGCNDPNAVVRNLQFGGREFFVSGVLGWIQVRGRVQSVSVLMKQSTYDSFLEQTINAIVTGETYYLDGENGLSTIIKPNGYTTTFSIECPNATIHFIGTGAPEYGSQEKDLIIPILDDNRPNSSPCGVEMRILKLKSLYFGGPGFPFLGLAQKMGSVLILSFDTLNEEIVSNVNAIVTGKDNSFLVEDKEMIFSPFGVTTSTIAITCNQQTSRFNVRSIIHSSLGLFSLLVGNEEAFHNDTITNATICENETGFIQNLYYNIEGMNISITSVGGDWLLPNPNVIIIASLGEINITSGFILGDDDCLGNSNQQCNGQGFAGCTDFPSLPRARSCDCDEGFTEGTVLSENEIFEGCQHLLELPDI